MHNIEKLYNLEEIYGPDRMWQCPEVGFRYGYLIVQDKAYNLYQIPTKRTISYIPCLCIHCNEKKDIRTSYLINGNTRSCGKKQCKFSPLGNLSGERLYRIWASMIQRCENLNSEVYKYYGLKGIKICEEWRYNYINFRIWALNNGYRDTLTIHRKNPNGNYEPYNCCWITLKDNINYMHLSYGRKVKSVIKNDTL